MDVGSRIKKYREKQNISQDELALKVFVSRQTISNWETNKCYPDIKSLLLLSNIFHVSLDDFMKGDIEKMKKKIDEEKWNQFHVMSSIFTAEFFLTIFSAYPLFCLDGYVGILIWIFLFILTFLTSLIVEKFKKNNDIQTFKEIVAFVEKKSLTYEEVVQEKGKRMYQKILLAILSGFLTFLIILMEAFLMKHV